MNNQISVKQFFNQDFAQQKLKELLGKNAASFATSVLQVVNDNDVLRNADPKTVFNASCMSATLNLPINNSLGFAYIIPFTTDEKDANGRKIPLLDANGNQVKNNGYNQYVRKTEAQFQIGYKGFIQLAQRTNQFKRINSCATYSQDTEQSVMERLTCFLPKTPKGDITGYIAYFQLLNGYEAHLSMTVDELKAHAKEYSQSYRGAEKTEWKQKNSMWHHSFAKMSQKTLIKLLLSKQAPLSIDAPLAQAVKADQAIIRDVDGTDFDYADNQVDVLEQPKVEMNITQDLEQFNTVKASIVSGNLEKASVLNGSAGYIISDQQRQELSAS